jgi:hypothetical protein
MVEAVTKANSENPKKKVSVVAKERQAEAGGDKKSIDAKSLKAKLPEPIYSKPAKPKERKSTDIVVKYSVL